MDETPCETSEVNTLQVNVPPPGRWVWNNEEETLEFVR